MQDEKRATETEMVVWHHQLNGLEFEKTPGDSEEQGSLVFYSPWGYKECCNLVTVQQLGAKRPVI